MSTYVITGSASGMGRATAEQLRAAGHTVIGVDLKDAEVIADLSTPEGRARAASEVLALASGGLDGAVLAAGIGPGPGADRSRLIYQINYFGVVDLLQAWRPALAANGHAKVVVFSSNSTTTTPLVPRGVISGLHAGDIDKAVRSVKKFGANASGIAYGGSKIAVSRWLRRAAVTPDWVGRGIRLNAIAPGAILTPLLQSQLDDPALAGAIEQFPVPTGGYGDPDQIASWVVFMLSPAADFMVGTLVFVDGGTDALFRSDDWPRPVPLRSLRRYMRIVKEFSARRG